MLLEPKASLIWTYQSNTLPGIQQILLDVFAVLSLATAGLALCCIWTNRLWRSHMQTCEACLMQLDALLAAPCMLHSVFDVVQQCLDLLNQ